MSVSAHSTTWYVSTSGSDSNSGTQTSPFLTIQKGVDSASSGDTVSVANGTYTYTGASDGILVNLNNSGSAGNLITLAAQNPGQVFLNGNSNLGGYGINVSANYWKISGLDISGFYNAGIFYNGGGGTSGQNISIFNNVVHNNGNVGNTSTSYGLAGMFANVNASNWIVNANVVHDNGRAGGLPNPNHDHGMYFDGFNFLVTNNIFYNALYGWHFQLETGASLIYLFNNTFYGPAGSEVPNDEPGSIVLADSNANVFIRNNIFYNPYQNGIFTYNSTISGSCNIDHNIVFSTTSNSLTMLNSTPAGCTVANNQLNVDPLLVSTGTLNFRLTSASPAISAGVVTSSVTSDFAGNSRSGGNDIGAFEFVSGGGTGVGTAKPGGWTCTLRQGNGASSGGATVTDSVSCNSGEIAMLGGCNWDNTTTTQKYSGAPTGQGYTCSGISLSGTHTITSYINCCK